MTEPFFALLYHQRRVGLVLWHPAAENILLTAGMNTKSTFLHWWNVDHYFPSTGSDNLVVIWNAGTGEPTIVIDSHPDLVYSACWNWDGSKLLTTCKDKKIRIINPRLGVVEEVFALKWFEKQQSTNTFFLSVQEAICHEGTKACRAIFLKNELIFTTGFSKVSERQYSLRKSGLLNEPMIETEVDTSNGVMFPFYDADTNIVYLCGKVI